MVRDDDGDGLGGGDGSDGADDASMVTRRVTRTRTGELRRGGSVTRDKQTIRSGDSSAR